MNDETNAKRNFTVTLRIKKKFFDQILAGTKTTEYRACKPYYDAILGRSGIRYLKLHYQQPRQAIVEVRGIRKLKTPARLRESFGPRVYAIQLGKASLL